MQTYKARFLIESKVFLERVRYFFLRARQWWDESKKRGGGREMIALPLRISVALSACPESPSRDLAAGAASLRGSSDPCEKESKG